MDRKRLAQDLSQQHDILGGKALIFRTKASGEVWQYRMWVAEEKKYVRKSLRTRDLQTAIQRAETEYLQTYADIKSGKKIFGITLGELVNHYVGWREKDVRTGKITAGRLLTIKSQLKHLLSYKSESIKVSELERQSLYDYAQHRRLTKRETRDVTIRNEQVTFNHMMEYAYRNGMAHFDKFEFETIKIKDVDRRDIFKDKEYDDLVRYMRVWSARKNCSDADEQTERLMIRDCILIASNTMLRVGELWQLKWGDIVRYEKAKDDGGKERWLVTIQVRREIAKTRKNRLITVRGGEYFKRLYERAKNKQKGDYIFCGSLGTKRFARAKFYAAWADLMKGIGLNYKERNVTWYSLRHYGVTCRLRAGASAFDIANIVGTGIIFIQEHYGHFDQSMARAVALKHFSYSKDGIEERAL